MRIDIFYNFYLSSGSDLILFALSDERIRKTLSVSSRNYTLQSIIYTDRHKP